MLGFGLFNLVLVFGFDLFCLVVVLVGCFGFCFIVLFLHLRIVGLYLCFLLFLVCSLILLSFVWWFCFVYLCFCLWILVVGVLLRLYVLVFSFVYVVCFSLIYLVGRGGVLCFALDVCCVWLVVCLLDFVGVMYLVWCCGVFVCCCVVFV